MNKPVRSAAQTELHLDEEGLCKYVGEKVVRVSIIEVDSDDSLSSEEESATVTRNCLSPLEEVDPAMESGLSLSGGPDAEAKEKVDHPAASGDPMGPAVAGEVESAQGERKKPNILESHESSDTEGNR